MRQPSASSSSSRCCRRAWRTAATSESCGWHACAGSILQIGFEDGVLKPYTPVEGHAASQERWRSLAQHWGKAVSRPENLEMDWPAFRVKNLLRIGRGAAQAPISFRYQRAEPLCDGLRSGSNTPPVTTTVGSKTASVVLDSDLLVEEERVTVIRRPTPSTR